MATRARSATPRITWLRDERWGYSPTATLIGRLLYGGFFVYNAFNHFLRHSGMTAYAASKGIPLAGVMVLVTGFLLLAGGLSILLGYRPRLGAWLLVLFLVPTAVLMHNFWAVADPAAAQLEQTQFLKDMALAGAALMLTAVPRWPFSLERGT